MAIISDLPPELLELIFHQLGSIDDVHHLGRAWKKAYDVVQRSNLYVEIMRSIIRTSPQHRHDLRLSKMLDLHRKIVEKMQQNNSQLPATRATQSVTDLNQWENAIRLATTSAACEDLHCSNCLPNEIVYEILARYQGLRVLENMWLGRQLMKKDYISGEGQHNTASFTQLFGKLQRRCELYEDGSRSSRNPKTPETALYTDFNPDQRGRFHTAVICVWLMNEVRWAFTNFVFPTRFSVQISLLENCKINIKEQRSVPLLDDLDQHAVFKFMYHHLLPQHSTFLQDRDLSKMPFTYASDFAKDPVHTARLLQLFLAAGQTYLQPPDLIELAVRSKFSRRHPYLIMTLPSSTEFWHRPSQAFAFPSNTHASLTDPCYKSLIQRASLTHLNLIARSSFHQTTISHSDTVNAPTADELYALKDHANYYFYDCALVAFEMHENSDKKLRSIREVMAERWEDELWSVWWWGNSEGKVRARLERWRALPEKRKP